MTSVAGPFGGESTAWAPSNLHFLSLLIKSAFKDGPE